MGDLTSNISRHEVACKCGCGQDTIDFETLTVVQGCVNFFRELEGRPVFIIITSANRCLEYNRKVGSKDTSQHVKGRAIDFVLYTLTPTSRNYIKPSRVYEFLNVRYEGNYGVGNYDNFTHLDTKAGPARRW